MTLANVLQFVFGQVWAMDESFHRRMMQVLVRRADGDRLTIDEIEAATGSQMPKRPVEISVEKGVATIPIHGVIAQRAGAVGRVSSRVGTSVEHIRADLREALARADVQSIVLDVDSPGGSVAGIDDLAEEIRAARSVKPIVAQTDGMMASAAYWLASQADRIVATRTSSVGSIGVIASFYDDHRRAQNEGFDPVVIKSVPGKAGVTSSGGVSDEGKADLQREVDAIHRLFVEQVAAGRGLELDAAARLGDGKVYLGLEALDRQLIDQIGTPSQARKLARSLGRQRVPVAIASTPAADAGARQDEEEPQMTAKNDESAATEKQAASTGHEPAKQEASATLAPAAETKAENQIETERKRTAAILEAADREQKDLAAQLVADGTPADEALLALVRDRRQRLAPPAAAALGGGNRAEEQVSPQQKLAALPDGPEKWAAHWDADGELRAEFRGDKNAWLAFAKAEHEGRIRR